MDVMNSFIGMMERETHEASHKKKFDCCPAGGRNCGQSGGRKTKLFLYFFS